MPPSTNPGPAPDAAATDAPPARDALPAYDPARVGAVVFDLGNVLVDLDNTRYGRGWPLDLVVEPDRADFARWAEETDVFRAYDTGRLDTDAFLARLAQRTGFAERRLVDYWNEILAGIDPQRYATLARLARRFPLYILSNTSPLHIAWVERHVDEAGEPDWTDRYFRGVVYSYEAGALKPEPAIYAVAERLAAERSGHGPADLLFVDDTPVNVEAACARGWQAEYLRPGRPVEELLAPLLAE